MLDSRVLQGTPIRGTTASEQALAAAPTSRQRHRPACIGRNTRPGEPTKLGFLQTRWTRFEHSQVARRPTRRPTLRQTTHQHLFLKRCAAFRSSTIAIAQQCCVDQAREKTKKKRTRQAAFSSPESTTPTSHAAIQTSPPPLPLFTTAHSVHSTRNGKPPSAPDPSLRISPPSDGAPLVDPSPSHPPSTEPRHVSQDQKKPGNPSSHPWTGLEGSFSATFLQCRILGEYIADCLSAHMGAARQLSASLQNMIHTIPP